MITKILLSIPIFFIFQDSVFADRILLTPYQDFNYFINSVVFYFYIAIIPFLILFLEFLKIKKNN